MLSLSPAKLLVVLVVALIVLGPEKLPQMARQFGSLWGDIRKWRSKLESEVRSTFPDLPPAHEVVRAVRSPLAFLDKLADAHENESNASDVSPADDPAPSADVSSVAPANPPVTQNSNGSSAATARQRSAAPTVIPDDPSMN